MVSPCTDDEGNDVKCDCISDNDETDDSEPDSDEKGSDISVITEEVEANSSLQTGQCVKVEMVKFIQTDFVNPWAQDSDDTG